MKLKTVRLADFLQTLIAFGKELQKIHDFNDFIEGNHKAEPNLWPLAYTNSQGGHYMWEHLFLLWESGYLIKKDT